MTDTFDPSSPDTGGSLKDMMRDLLVRDSFEREASSAQSSILPAMRLFGATTSDQSESLGGSSFVEPSPMGRMFSTKFGSEAASRVGNETRTLSALNHLSSELIAETLRLTDQVGPDDRILLSTLYGPTWDGDKPVVVVLTDRVTGPEGRVQSDDLFLPHEAIRRTLYNGESALGFAQSLGRRTPEYEVLDQALKSDADMAELMVITQPEVLYFPQPEMIDLSAPTPAYRIVQGNEVSSSGVLCTDADGRIGITACFHGTGPEGTKITVDGHELTVSLADRLQDLVFISLEDAPELTQGLQRGEAGLREEHDLAPAPNEPFTFDGIMNPATQTFVQSSDPWLFNLDPNAQIRLQTTRDTDKGDSGSALIDRNDKLAAFAFRMTGYGVRPEFTDWIWAPNALASLGLTLQSQ